MRRLSARLLALLLGATMVLTSCASTTTEPSEKPAPTETKADDSTETEAAKPTEDTKKDDVDNDDATVDPDGSYSIAIAEPKTLLPPNADESFSVQVLQNTFDTLTLLKEDKSIAWGDNVPDAAAQDIAISDDGLTYTIKIKPDRTFHNGDPVNADSFVDAWNYIANPDAAASGTYMFVNIKGYQDVQDKKAKTLSGLKKIDDLTFEVTLEKPFSPFLGMLTYIYFVPLPKLFFDDVEAFKAKPIGNGPLQFREAHKPNEFIKLERFEDYKGNKAKAKYVDLPIYADFATGYNDLLAGNVDITATIPKEQMPTAEADLDGRVFSGPGAGFTYVAIPLYQKALENKDLRHALSLAIDRKTITETIGNGSFKVADDFIAPSVTGYVSGECEYCQYDPERAKELYDKAGGIDGPLEMWYFTGWGYDEWMEAVSNYWIKNLGVSEVKFRTMPLAEYFEYMDDKKMTGPFAMGWSMDYPSAESYLSIWTPKSTANHSSYSNDEYNKLVDEGSAESDSKKADELFAKASTMLKEDLPAIPMFFNTRHGGYSERVRNFKINELGNINMSEIEVLAE